MFDTLTDALDGPFGYALAIMIVTGLIAGAILLARYELLPAIACQGSGNTLAGCLPGH